LLRARRAVLHGILNGIDETIWDPWADPYLPMRFSQDQLAGKAMCKTALQAELGLADAPGALVYGLVSRLTGQKGIDMVLDDMEELLANGAQLAVLGSGDTYLEDGFRAAMEAHPGQVAVTIGYNEPLAHRIVAGTNALLVPSRFEPCGLTQMMAMRYGTVPVVSRVGGLADTVIDANEAALRAGVATGVMGDPSPIGLRAALVRTADLWADQAVWGQMPRSGMAADFGWTASAARYEAVLRG
jgi:starch synthase